LFTFDGKAEYVLMNLERNQLKCRLMVMTDKFQIDNQPTPVHNKVPSSNSVYTDSNWSYKILQCMVSA